MPVLQITTSNDPRIAPYLNLKDRELAREGDRFIVEGEQVVRRLIGTRYPIDSVLVAEKHVAELSKVVPAGVPLLVAPGELVNAIIGFKFHSGVMAVGHRGRRQTLDDVLQEKMRLTVAVVEDINNSENLGSLIRLAAGFGVDALLLGERCTDPFFRRTIRVSMGTVFHVPIVRSTDLLVDLQLLKNRWGVELVATVLADDAEPLATARGANRIGLCFGSESQGLSRGLVDACDRRVTIPMQRGTDSLNVSVAAGIVLYHFTQYASHQCR